jgi:hypothetical protein
MQTRAQTVEDQPFFPLKRRIEAWRSTRRPGAAMPEELWQDAVRLAAVQGTGPTARALRVDYGMLKKRLDRDRAGGGRVEQHQASAFVDVGPATDLVSTASLAAAVMIELRLTSGEQLTFRLPPGHGLDVGALLRDFRRPQ